ncbi:hypothetical protein LCGC14_0401060 [marine sediment metagenome]|uniref:LamG-like jellyroll fold domain-containing protein n=1 Tax=marine sediment metagenome TaxID=412755 RepID=A0A0F9W5W2_9ZZZZ
MAGEKIKAVLEYQGRELDLNDLTAGLYTLAEGFIPPPVSLVPTLSRGTAANIRGGAELASMKADNRPWDFAVNVRGASEAEITGGIRRLNQFLRQATGERPVNLLYRSNRDVGFEPLWGSYGADLQYEIVFGKAMATLAYPTGVTPNLIIPECRISLEVKPYALSQRQRMAFAQGGILEDLIGAIDGFSRGTFIPEATTNKMTNPIFGNATFDNAWTAGANIVKAENTDRKFITHGKSSAKLSAVAATTNTFTQSIAVGDTVQYFFSAYVKLPGGGVPTSSDLQLHYGSDQTTTFRSVGDGWYRMTVEVTGVVAATNTGVVVKSGRTVYVDGFQIEKKVSTEIEQFTSVAHGDLLDCAWTGTSHASTTTRIRTQLSVNKDDAFDVSEGTVQVVVKWETDNTRASSAFFFFLSGSIQASFSSGSDRIQFSDGTDTVLDDGNTFSPGDIWILHFVFGPNGKKIYLDGVELATTATYTPNAGTGDLFIGCTGLVGQNFWGSLMDFATYAQAMSAAEVLADFNNIDKQVEDDRRLAPIPWFWTRNGDGLIENCNDGTKLNYAVAGGIPGSAPALTRLKVKPDTIFTGASDIWLSLYPQDEFIDPDNNIWDDEQGTVEAGACGGQVNTINISGSASVTIGITNIKRYELVAGKDIYLLIRLRDIGTNLLARFEYEMSGSQYETDFKALAATTTQKLFVLGPLPFLSYKSIVAEFGDAFMDEVIDADVTLKRTTGTAANDCLIDFVMLVARPFVLIQNDLNVSNYYLLEDVQCVERVASGDQFVEFVSTLGDVIEFEPEKTNILTSMMGRDGEDHEVDDDDFDYLDVVVTPRWELL